MSILKQQLRDKDAKLTDIRLEALSSAHQLEQLRETMTKMKVTLSPHSVILFAFVLFSVSVSLSALCPSLCLR